MENKELALLSFELREKALEIIYRAKTGHIGGDFSVMDILVQLYFKQMNISPENWSDPARDRFVLSKGHSVESYYTVLSEKGFFSYEELLNTFSCFGSRFIGHPNNKIPGVEMNSGSLGHGLSVCTGMALASKMDEKLGKKPYRVYTVMGDGELAEGSVWEAAMAASFYKLDNLCAVVDRNHLQISGPTEEVMAHEPLDRRFESFGWHVIPVNGNDHHQLDGAFREARETKSRPSLILADTVKGFGSSVMEGKAAWHHKVPSEEEYLQIKKDLRARRARILEEEASR